MKAFLLIIVLTIGLYFTVGIVVDVDCEEDTVTVLLRSGHLFAFYGAEDWQLGNVALLTMNGMHSKDVTDDQIVRAWNLAL